MTHHAPADCPVCGRDLIVTRKGCRSCGSELTGEFTSCKFCVLSADEIQLLEVFLASRGNLREVEKHLGVSYPTARARYDALVAKLGIATQPQPEAVADDPAQPSAQEQILARVAAGELSSEDAARLISALG